MSTFVVPSGRVDARARQPRWLSVSVVASLVAAVAIGGVAPILSVDVASAAPAAAAGVPETVTADTLPVPQISAPIVDKDGTVKDSNGGGVVWDQVVIGTTVYVAGSFTNARPFGAKPGEGQVVRQNLLAYDLNTGELLPFAHSVDAQVQALAASPDGKRLYVGGSFTTIDGQKRQRLAAFDVSSGALVDSFRPSVNREVKTLVATDSTLYAGGGFRTVNPDSTVMSTALNQARMNAAAFALDGSVTGWSPQAGSDGKAPHQVGTPETKPKNATWNVTQNGNESVLAMVLSPDGSKMVLGGTFRELNGSIAQYTMGAVDTNTGKTNAKWVYPTDPKVLSRNLWADVATYGLSSDADNVYAALGSGPTEGTFALSWRDGSLVWAGDCRGDTYSTAPGDGVVYTASHAHNCETVGSFSNYVPPKAHYRALAFTSAMTQPITAANKRPRPSVLNWFPAFDSNVVAGQATWDVTVAQGFVLYGGEFRHLNGAPQQGLARMTTPDKAPNKVGPYLSGAEMNPTVTAGDVTARLEWGINFDWDDDTLRYDVIRDGQIDSPVYSETRLSLFWKWRKSTGKDGFNSPGARIETMNWTDVGLTPGQTYRYQIRTVDPHGNSSLSEVVTFTMPANPKLTPSTAYDRDVLSDGPMAYWPFNETDGVSYATDWAASNDMRVINPATRIAGSERSDTGRAISLSKTWAAAAHAARLPADFTQELWFKTSSKTGGSLMAFSDVRGHSAKNWSRQIFMDNRGRVLFNAYSGSASLATAAAYNDNTWHHVAVTSSAQGVSLFIDGKRAAGSAKLNGRQVFAGYWSEGGFPLTGRTGADIVASSIYFTGQLDNMAVYPRVLTNAEIAQRYALATTVVNQAPVASFTTQSTGLEISTDGRASTDKDGSVATYAWDFGDGTSATGATASHVFANAGTYSVVLTVTDNSGAVGRKSIPVTVTHAGAVAEDAFERSSVSGWGPATVGGDWSTGKGSTTSVANGTGNLVGAKGQTSTVALPGAMSDSSDTSVSFRVDNAPTGGGQHVWVTGRQVGADSYAARVLVQSNGVLQLLLQQSGKNLAVLNLPDVKYTPGEQVHVRFQVSGSGTTTLQAKVWTTGAEPAGWTKAVTDTTAALQAAGSVGLGLFVSGTATAPSTVSFDDYVVKRVTP